MYIEGRPEFEHHIKTYGPQSRFGYKDFIPQFKAEKFDPDAWASLFRKAGARFVVPVAEHHDGFAMYDSALTEWNAAKMGPKRDVIGELAAAVKKQWLTFGLSSHRAEHWWFFDGGNRFDSDVSDPRYAGLYGPAQLRNTQPSDGYLSDWFARTRELVDKYEPQLVWFDWWIEQPAFDPYLRKFAAYYYNRALEWQKEVAINYKYEAFKQRSAVFDVERGQLSDIRRPFWQTDTSVGKKSWSYVEGEEYKTAKSIIGDLVDIVSKNGALLLNIGPRADGTIPTEQQDILLSVGSWLGRYGEAIYSTRPWKVFGEGPTEVVEGSFNDTSRKSFTSTDIRFTEVRTEAREGSRLYAIVMDKPAGDEVVIRTLSSELTLVRDQVKSVSLAGAEGQPEMELKWHRGSRGLRVKVPTDQLSDGPFALKITFG
jgi:alpha-L-fucosidase